MRKILISCYTAPMSLLIAKVPNMDDKKVKELTDLLYGDLIKQSPYKVEVTIERYRDIHTMTGHLMTFVHVETEEDAMHFRLCGDDWRKAGKTFTDILSAMTN